MNEDTFYCEMTDTIGQMEIEDADKEIQRMQQQTRLKWRKDFSSYIFVTDETDDDIYNPTPLSKGNCWVVTDNEIIK